MALAEIGDKLEVKVHRKCDRTHVEKEVSWEASKIFIVSIHKMNFCLFFNQAEKFNVKIKLDFDILR